MRSEADGEYSYHWLPSGANPADLPSRPDDEEEAAGTLTQHGAQPGKIVWPEEASWESGRSALSVSWSR